MITDFRVLHFLRTCILFGTISNEERLQSKPPRGPKRGGKADNEVFSTLVSSYELLASCVVVSAIGSGLAGLA